MIEHKLKESEEVKKLIIGFVGDWYMSLIHKYSSAAVYRPCRLCQQFQGSLCLHLDEPACDKSSWSSLLLGNNVPLFFLICHFNLRSKASYQPIGESALIFFTKGMNCLSKAVWCDLVPWIHFLTCRYHSFFTAFFFKPDLKTCCMLIGTVQLANRHSKGMASRLAEPMLMLRSRVEIGRKKQLWLPMVSNAGCH